MTLPDNLVPILSTVEEAAAGQCPQLSVEISWEKQVAADEEETRHNIFTPQLSNKSSTASAPPSPNCPSLLLPFLITMVWFGQLVLSPCCYYWPSPPPGPTEACGSLGLAAALLGRRLPAHLETGGSSDSSSYLQVFLEELGLLQLGGKWVAGK